MLKVKLQDNKEIEVAHGASYLDVAELISPSFKKRVLAVVANGEAVDLTRPIVQEAQVDFILKDDPRAFEVYNHSCAHLMAQAIKNLYPHALFWVGPAIEEGFYYDIDLQEDVIKEQDFAKIENEMRRLVKQGQKVIRQELTKEQALVMFANDVYKMDLIQNLEENTIISVYQQGDFVDLCRGPHVITTAELKHFKLLKASGAYFKGDSKNKMLQRVYGICFGSEEQLKNYLHFLEEAKKRDHKKLGRELGLFMMSEYGPGFPFWLPNGVTLRRELENYWYAEHTKEGYQFIFTPVLLNQELWQVSGHWYNYRENMYLSEIDDKKFAIKPMNCPGGMLVYRHQLHSYKELPLRVGELGLVHRHEASGALNGLFRVRNFTQDDAHIFMREDQIESEIIRLLGFIDRVYAVFGLEYSIELSTRPEEKFIGEIAVWEKAEQALAQACQKAGKPFKINPGDGAFYGPKLDLKIRDSLNRVWQCGTIQLDFNLPERFDLTYIAEDGSKQRPVMLHRVIFGSIERFIGILIEHYGGIFPLWLAPIQVKILSVNPETHGAYVRSLQQDLQQAGLRVEIDNREEKLGYKMRESQMQKIPYVLVIGDEEMKQQSLNYRRHGKADQTAIGISEFVKMLKEEITNKN